MRGKKGASAARRRAVEASEQEITTYQRRVRDLAAERDALRQELLSVREESNGTLRELRARLAEGAAPEVEARDVVIAQLRDDLGRARAAKRDAVTSNARLFSLLCAVLEESGMTQIETIEWIGNRLPEFADPTSQSHDLGWVAEQSKTLKVDMGAGKKLSAEQVRRIQRARGMRS